MSFLTSLRPTAALHRSLALSCKPQPTRSFAASPAARLARITIVGRLADAPELVPTSTGSDVIKYALGTNHGPKDNRQTSWWRVLSYVPEGPGRDLLMGLGKGYVGFLGFSTFSWFFFLFFFLVVSREDVFRRKKEGGRNIRARCNGIHRWEPQFADTCHPCASRNYRSKLFVEADCTLNKYINRDGVHVKGVSVTQSKLFPPLSHPSLPRFFFSFSPALPFFLLLFRTCLHHECYRLHATTR